MRTIQAPRIAELAIGVLILITIRTIAEVLWLAGPAISPDTIRVYLVGALAASMSALICHVLIAFKRHGLIIGLTAVTIAGLIWLKLTYV